MNAAPRIIVVGAGPAGMRAAQALVEAGIRPIVIDEGQRSGGQVYRRQPEGFSRSYAKLYGSEAGKAESVHRDFDALRERIDYRPDTLAWNLSAGVLHVVQGGRAANLPFDALLVCSGATDRLMPVPGWNQSGCYSLGASQIALKAQACAIGSQVVFMGSGPLLYLVANQYVIAGAKVVAVLDTAPKHPSLAALRGLFARPQLALRGLGLIRGLRKAGVVLRKEVVPLRIEGDAESGVSAVTVRSPHGEERFACDAVGMGWHLRSESQLADLGRCEFAFDQVSRQWLPVADADGRSSVPGIYLAGDGVRILGADGAEAAGRLAALAALADLHVAGARTRYQSKAPSLHATLRTMARFREGLACAFPWPHQLAAQLPDDTVVCRCEVITAGELRSCVSDKDAHEVNRAKAISRVGMGRCQGRYCGHASAEIIAAASGLPVEAVGRIRTQAPVKPLQMDTLEAEPNR